MPLMKRKILKTMCKETKIHEQKLIAQLPLQLSPSEESCVTDNRLDLFENNGFRYAMLGVDGACSLNGYVAGLAMGADGEGKAGRQHAGTGNITMFKLPKSIAMFGGCQYNDSIMIGDCVTRSKMEAIL